MTMMLRPVLKTAPADKPVSVAGVKAALRIDFDEDDGLVGALIDAAISHLDGWGGILGRCMIDQVWTQTLPAWPCGQVRLAFPDVSSVVVSYRDPDDAVQVIADTNYRLIERADATAIEWIDGFSLPSLASRSDAITIDMTAGYGAAAADVPAAILRAIELLVGHWYQNREAVVVGTIVADLPFAVSALLSPYRRVGV